MRSSASVLALAAAFPSVFAATYDVQVGPGGKFVYEPPTVHAMTGDVINFIFNPKNHTVTQSAFDPPCVPLAGGFRTGFVPVAAGATDVQSKQFTVPDNGGAPIWFYCGQAGHCGAGMVFAVNAPADPDPRSFAAFQALAIARNGTAASASGSASASASWTSPPAPHWQSATATVTQGASTWTTTYSSYDGTPDPTPAVQPAEHKIIVGADGQLVYSPANITAAIGDTVTFEFHPKNHTVTQSSFSRPCEALPAGFKSGFRPVAAGATDFPVFSIKVNDTAPIWGYCGQTGHCQAGMVFSINAVESGPNNFAAFQDLAKRSGTVPTGSGVSSGAASAPTASQRSSSVISAPPSAGLALIFAVAAFMGSAL